MQRHKDAGGPPTARTWLWAYEPGRNSPICLFAGVDKNMIRTRVFCSVWVPLTSETKTMADNDQRSVKLVINPAAFVLLKPFTGSHDSSTV